MATTREMLDELLKQEKLTDHEKDAFQSMLEGVTTVPRRKLTDRQVEWIGRRYVQLGLGSAGSSGPSPGKVSSGKSSGKVTIFPWEIPGYQKPLKPPGKNA